MDRENDIQEKVVRIFQEHGHNRRQLIEERLAYEIFDNRSLKATGNHFSTGLFEEIMEQCRKSLIVSPQMVAEAIQQAVIILEKNIHDAVRSGGILDDRMTILEEKEDQLESLREKSHPEIFDRETQVLQQEINELKMELNSLKADTRCFERDLELLVKVFLQYKPRLPLKTESQQSHMDPNLLEKVFFLNCFGMLLELFVTSIRPSLMAVLYHLHVFYLLFMGYYSLKAGMFLVFQSIITIILDFGFFFLMIFEHQLKPQDRFPSTEKVLILILEILLGISIICRVIQLVLLYPFKEAPIGKFVFTILGHEFTLRKRIKIRRFQNYY